MNLSMIRVALILFSFMCSLECSRGECTEMVRSPHLSFQGSPPPTTSCHPVTAFSPESYEQMVEAIRECFKKSAVGDCQDTDYPQMEFWNVSNVTLLVYAFNGRSSFNSDISNWDVSNVTNMHGTFGGAKSFNADISKWDVSSVKEMGNIFNGATSFSRTLCGYGWIVSQAPKHYTMFTGSSAQICFGIKPALHSVSTM